MSPEQYAWLTNELARPETQRAAFRVACFHKPPYCNLWNGGGYDGEGWVRSDWAPLFKQYHVDMVINGHSHCYDRGTTNGVTYIITGGGGGAVDTERVTSWPFFTVEYSLFHYDLMQINARQLTWTTYDNSNTVLDHFTLSSRVPRLSLVSTQGALSLVLEGKPGETCVMETSTNLIDWKELSTNTIPDTGMSSITPLLSPNETKRFIRARANP
jgi:hypothetical protein